MSRPLVAAITLDPAGGGVAAVSRLVWDVVQARWPDESRLFTLLDEAGASRSLETPTRVRLRFGARVARAQALRECDWLLCTHLSVARVQSFVPPPIRRPYAVFLHGIEVWRPLTGEQRAVLRGAALLLANSAFTARTFTAMHPDTGPVTVCPLALPRNRQAVASRCDTLPASGPGRVLLVARMSASERYKGHDELLDAWPTVLARVPGAELVLAGDGDDAARLRAKASDLGLGGTVIFTGFVPDATLRSLYASASVFAMPSRGEGFGLVYLEAMAHGLPCIGASDDAAGDVIADGVTGYLVPQADQPALTDRIVRLLTDPGLRRAMGEAGRRRWQDEFSYDRFAQRIGAALDAHLVLPGRSWSRDVAV